jgi:hypothetical protein
MSVKIKQWCCKSNWPSLLLVFTVTSLVASYFWVFGSVVQPPLDEDNVVNMHRGGLSVFDVPVSVSNEPTDYKATIKAISIFSNRSACFYTSS